MLEKPIFFHDCEFISDDNSNFLDEYVSALSGIQKYYGEEFITTASIALIQATTEEYLFIVSRYSPTSYDIIKVSGFGDKQNVTKIASFEKLKLREND